MAKVIPKRPRFGPRPGFRPRPRFDSRRNKRISSRNTGLRIPKIVIHVQASFHNTIVTVTDIRGRPISCSSTGMCEFKGRKKRTPFAAQTAARDAIKRVREAMERVRKAIETVPNMQQAEVLIKGPGPGRNAALRAICQSGILFSFIRDVTPMPHNGCRPPKRRRV